MRVDIPDSLAAEIERLVPAPPSPEEFVLEAVRDRLSWEDRRREFCRLSDETRAAMAAKGLTEADILRDFEDFRHRLSEQARG